MEQLAALPQRLHCKLSGLATEAAPDWTPTTLRPYVDHLIENFGPERLMWGSDWPVLNLNGDYARWSTAAHSLTERLGASAQQAIFGGTAQAFYRL
jgi:L-fuconolactonase